MSQPKISRRTLLAAGAATLAAPNIVFGASATKEPVRIGLIGGGVRGWDLAEYLGVSSKCKVVAVCDVYEPHIDRAIERGNNPDAKRYRNYQDLLSDTNVEAVVIATPDHWHEKMVIDAVQADKAIYCEKGLTTSIASAKRMRGAVKKNGTVFQLGHQGRQHASTAAAAKRIENGDIGELTFIKTGRYFNGPKERAPYRWYGWYSNYDRPDPKKVLTQLDWEAWLGDAPQIDFNDRHFWHWRCYWAYGTGQAGDLLSHELDHVQSVLRMGIPDSCACLGYNTFHRDDREIPDSWMATYTFEDHNRILNFEGCMNSERVQPPEYVGKAGRLVFNGIGQDASTFVIYPDGSPYTHMGNAPEPEYEYDPAEGEQWPTHMEEFLDSVRSGEPTKCDIDQAFIEAATLLMSVESYNQKRQVRWDRDKEEIV